MFFLGLQPAVTQPTIHSDTNPVHGLDDLEAILSGEDACETTSNGGTTTLPPRPPPVAVPPPASTLPPPPAFDPTWDLLPPASALQYHMSLGEPAPAAVPTLTPQQPPPPNNPQSFRQRRPTANTHQRNTPLLSPLHRSNPAMWQDVQFNKLVNPSSSARTNPNSSVCQNMPPLMSSIVVAACAAAAGGLAAGPLGVAVGLKSGALVMASAGTICGTAYHMLANNDPQQHPTAVYLLPSSNGEEDVCDGGPQHGGGNSAAAGSCGLDMAALLQGLFFLHNSTYVAEETGVASGSEGGKCGMAWQDAEMWAEAVCAY